MSIYIPTIIEQAFEWVTQRAQSAVSTISRAPGNQSSTKLLDAQGSTTADPSGSSDGVDVEGWKTLQFYYSHASAGNTSEIEIWLYDGSAWYPDQTVALDADSDVLQPYDLEGSWERVYTKLTTAPANTVTLNVFPHNE